MQPWDALILSGLMLGVLRSQVFEATGNDFCYKEAACGPYVWGKNFPSCVPNNNKLHSPIDLGNGLMENNSIPPLELVHFDYPQAYWTVTNVQYTVVVEFDVGMMVKGPWERPYRVVDMRFHWGSSSTNGSEHTLNKRRFPMEMQIVAVGSEFQNEDFASAQPSDLVMIGVFLDIGAKENVHFKSISDALIKVPYPVSSVRVTPPALLKLLPATSTRVYYYKGGQTTPPCLQTVEWVVFEKPVLISKDQYLKFADGLYYVDKNNVTKLLVENYRPIQSSSNHQVFASSKIKVRSARGAAQDHHALFIPISLLFSLLPLILSMA